MSIQVDGIVSGMDTSALISSLVGVYSIPKGMIEADIDAAEDKKVRQIGMLKKKKGGWGAKAPLSSITSTQYRHTTPHTTKRFPK